MKTSDLSTVFGDLADAPLWVAWKEERRGDDLTKVPVSPVTGHNASSVDPATWGTLEDAQYLADERGLAGVGIVLGDGLGGVDLDACRNSETGEIAPWARKIVDGFDTYTEVSPSGTGLKLFAYGAPSELPASTIPIDAPSMNGKRPAIECYVARRYFTVTGQLLEGCTDEIRDAGDIGDAWDRLARLLSERAGQNGSAPPVEGSIPAGGRNSTLTSLGGSMRRRGMSRDAILAALSTENRTKCDPPLSEREVQDIARSVTRYEPAKQNGSRPRVRCLADVEPETVGWVWKARIPRSKLSEITGDPGEGKSTVTAEIVACITTGRALPDDEPRPIGTVLLLSAEDGAGDTIRPRLDRAGADVSRVHILDGIEAEGVLVPLDLQNPLHRVHLANEIERLGPSLVVIDPLSAYLGGTDSHRDSNVRVVLAPLAEIAESTGTAIVFVRHLNKGSGTKAIYRSGGSIGFVAAVRSSMLVGRVDEESDERAILVVKSNLAAVPPPVGFTLKDGDFQWTGTPDVHASDLLRQDADSDERSAVDEAADWLRATLKSGPVASEVLTARADKEVGVSSRTLRRARKLAGVVSEAARDENGRLEAWVCRLSDEPLHQVAKPGQVATDKEAGHLVETQQRRGESEEEVNQAAKHFGLAMW